MNKIKENNMMNAYKGFKGHQTVTHIKSMIPDFLKDRLTGAELGEVMNAINSAYHAGRATLKGIDVVDDCVWLPWGGGKYNPDEHLPGSVTPKTGENGQLIPIDAIRKIKITKSTGKTEYTMVYTENI